jgi:aspartyl-tRNA(Asn)/glutamyl-tRNA(Gln) amidotransferase subunit B
VRPRSIFARKNYFYPDLPKGYQISQYAEPLAEHGGLDVETAERGMVRVGITRLHLEEDAAKSFHDRVPGMTAVDFNRSGVPLIEIVSEPDLRSPAEARAYLTALKRVLKWIEVSDCNMEEGSLRVDANVSVRRPGAPYGTRTEVKNLNSFANVERALTFERDRQIALIEGGGAVEQRTMTFDAATGEVRPMRSKEESHDYRYFPEPDLPPLVLSEPWLGEATRLTELPAARASRFVDAFGLSAYEAGVLTGSCAVADYFEAVVGAGIAGRDAANWVMNDVLALSDDGETLPVAATDTAEVIRMAQAGQVSRQAGKRVLAELARSPGRPPLAVAQALGLIQVQDSAQIETWVAETLAAHPAEVERYRQGETKLLGYLVGQVMKRSTGKADPKAVNAALAKALAT